MFMREFSWSILNYSYLTKRKRGFLRSRFMDFHHIKDIYIRIYGSLCCGLGIDKLHFRLVKDKYIKCQKNFKKEVRPSTLEEMVFDQ